MTDCLWFFLVFKSLITGPSDVGAQCPSPSYESNNVCCCSDGCCWDKCWGNWDKFTPPPVDCLQAVPRSEWIYSTELGHFQAVVTIGISVPKVIIVPKLRNFCVWAKFFYFWTIWQYGLWSFQTVGTKLERFLPQNQHTQILLLNFENWVNGEVPKIGHHFSR